MQNNLEEQRVINHDPREQKYDQSSYAGRAYRKPRGGVRNFFLGIILIVLIVTGVAFWGLVTVKNVATLPVHTFQVGDHARLVVSNTSGKISIHAGKANSIIVQGTKYARGFSANVNDIQVNYQQQGDTVSVTSDESLWSFMSERDVDLDITVPSTTDLKIENTSGNVDIERVSGQIEARTVSGNVEASGLNGNAQLSTTSGNILLENANGTMRLSTVSGGIEADNSQLHSTSSLMTTSGGIKFEGTLDPQGNYRMETISGGIDLTLPSNAAFKLDASTTSGNVNNEFGSTTVGSAPQPALTLHTTSGGIEIHKQ